MNGATQDIVVHQNQTPYLRNACVTFGLPGCWARCYGSRAPEWHLEVSFNMVCNEDYSIVFASTLLLGTEQ
jgi:hypothetical protein